MEAVLQAVKTARYNEAVVVKLETDDPQTEPREMILVAVLDEENGGVVWRDVAQEPDFSDDVRIVRHLRTKRWMLPMLNDTRRNQLYGHAIEAATAEAVRRSRLDKGTFNILDIGSGSGLLAMLALKHTDAALSANRERNQNDSSAVPVQVTSLEMASAMASLARGVIASNGMQDRIKIIEAHSGEVSLSDKSRLCTSELLESGLLGEGILPAMRDAWERHLHPDAVVVPQRARVYAQLVDSDFAGRCHGPETVVGSDGDTLPLRLHISSDENDVMLGHRKIMNGEGTTVPVHVEALLDIATRTEDGNSGVRTMTSARALNEPVLAMDFDFSSKEALPPSTGRSKTIPCMSHSFGVVNAILFWWELDLYAGSTYSTKPGSEWQDHWHQCVYILPYSHKDCIRVSKGETLELICSHSDYRLDFGVTRLIHSEEPTLKRRRFTASSLTEPWITSDRALQLNDRHRICLLRRGIATALNMQDRCAPVLDLSDFSLCAIMAALEGAILVTSVESSTGRVPQLSARVAQIANGLPLPAKKDVEPRFQILQCHAENLSLPAMFDRRASIVVAEPFYEILEGWHLQEALQYHYLVRSLRRRQLINETAVAVPSYAAVMACGVQCSQLYEAYRGVGRESGGSICGFDHSLVNEHGDLYHNHDLSVRMWEYQHSVLTERVELVRIWFEGPSSIDGNGECQAMAFDREGTCHGMLCWIEYGIRVGESEGRTSFERLSTFTTSHRQTFRMLASPENTSGDDKGSRRRLLCKTFLGGLGSLEDHDFELTIE